MEEKDLMSPEAGIIFSEDILPLQILGNAIPFGLLVVYFDSFFFLLENGIQL